MIGQLRHNAELHTLQAFIAEPPQRRIALLRLAHEAALREEAIARWRGDAGFLRFEPPLRAFVEGLAGRNAPQWLFELPRGEPVAARLSA